MYYEQLKHSGELPIIGVNTYINPNASIEEIDKRLETYGYNSKQEIDCNVTN